MADRTEVQRNIIAQPLVLGLVKHPPLKGGWSLGSPFEPDNAALYLSALVEPEVLEKS